MKQSWVFFLLVLLCNIFQSAVADSTYQQCRDVPVMYQGRSYTENICLNINETDCSSLTFTILVASQRPYSQSIALTELAKDGPKYTIAREVQLSFIQCVLNFTISDLAVTTVDSQTAVYGCPYYEFTCLATQLAQGTYPCFNVSQDSCGSNTIEAPTIIPPKTRFLPTMAPKTSSTKPSGKPTTPVYTFAPFTGFETLTPTQPSPATVEPSTKPTVPTKPPTESTGISPVIIGVIIAGVVVVFLAGVGGYVWWKKSRASYTSVNQHTGTTDEMQEFMSDLQPEATQINFD